MPTPSLPLTGERTLPGIPRENYWFRRHEAVYRWIVEHRSATGTVVEAGCGEGYGADLLRATADQVVAVDYDDATLAHARRRYPAIQVVRANLIDLPLRSGTVDTVVSLQVVEHLWDLPRFLAECRRVLRPGGRLVVSTPNRLTFSPGVGRGEKPTNPFHVEEFDAAQLAGLLADAGFEQVHVLGLRHHDDLDARAGDLVARQIAAALADEWPADLLDAVAAVTIADFAIGAVRDTDLDLIAVARR